MKVNYVGIVGGILAFISLALPWWALITSSSYGGYSYSTGLSVYPYQATASVQGISATVDLNLWFGWTALALIMVGGVLAIVGSVIGAGGRIMLGAAGMLALLSIIIFAGGLQSQLSSGSPASGFPVVGLFSSGSFNMGVVSLDYSSYLSFGFWIALVATILMFVALARRPVEQAVKPAPAPSLTPSPAPT